MSHFHLFFLFFFNLLLRQINCVTGLNTLFNPYTFSGYNVSGTLLTNNGSTIYVSLSCPPGYSNLYPINVYNISNNPYLQYKGQFLDPYNVVKANKFFIYNNTYLIAYQTMSNVYTFNVFYLSNYSYYRNYTISESITQFYHVSSKGIILYTESRGLVKYILQSNFLPTSSNNMINVTINSNYPVPPLMIVSPDQNYVAIGTSQYVTFQVLQLTNYTIVTNFSFNSTSSGSYGISNLIWRSNNVLVVLTAYNCRIYQVSIPAGTISSSSTALLVPTCSNLTYNTMYPYDLIYVPSTDQIVAIEQYYQTPQPFLAFFSFSLSTLEVTYFANLSYIAPPTFYNNYYHEKDNNLLYCINNLTHFYCSGIITSCQSPLVYNVSTYQCEIPIIINVTNTTNTTTNQTNATAIANSTNLTNQTNATIIANSTNQTNTTIIANSTNQTNQTNTKAIANSTNLTSQTNATTIANSTNLTNQTNATTIANSTNITNQTNATVIANQTNTTAINNTTNSSNLFVISDNTSPTILDFQIFINRTLGSQQLIYLNSVPGSRNYLRPIFTFFANFDDIWLYVYHQREYDVAVDSVFSAVQSLESQKWNLLPMHTIWQFLGLQSDNTINQFSSKLSRTSYKFYDVQQNSNGFIVNTLTFLCSNVFLMLIMFLILHILFQLLFNYKISIIFRNYSFWLYFLIVMLQGNLQYLTFLFSFQLQNFFSVDYINKFGLAIAAIVFFILFIFSVTFYPIVKYKHGKLVRYFVQNLKLSEITAFYIAIQMGYRNILLGFLHSILEQHYFIKIGSLMAVQITFLVLTVVQLSKNMIFQNHLKVWVNVIATLLRILLIFTFFLDYQNIYTNIELIHIQIFYIYISEMLFSILIQTIRLFLGIKNFIFNQKATEFIKSTNNLNNQFNSKINVNKILQKKKKNMIKITYLDQRGKAFQNKFNRNKTSNNYQDKTKMKNQKESNSFSKKINQLVQNASKININLKRRYKIDRSSFSPKTNIIFTQQTKRIAKSQSLEKKQQVKGIKSQKNKVQIKKT